jgi:pilus assembly protein CpaE
VAHERQSVLLVCSERDAAARLAALIQSDERHVIAAPWSDAARGHVQDVQLIVVDQVGEAGGQADVVAHLRTALGPAATPILCVAASDDVDERIALLEAGADDVVVRPFHPDELRARVEGLLAVAPTPAAATSTATSAPVPRDNQRVISFLAPKGGVGTTMVAVNAAVAAARAGHSTALVDLDLEWGQVATHLNIAANFSVVELARDVHALADPEQVRAYGHRHPSGVTVFAAPQRPDQAMMVDQSHVVQLLDGLRGTFERVIVDAGSDYDERTLTVVESSDRVVLLTVPEIPAVRSMRTLLELLAELGSPPERQFLLLNHIFEHDMLRRDDIERTVQATIQAELAYDGLAYQRSINEGTPLLASPTAGTATKHLESVIAAVLEEAVGNTEAAAPASRFRLRRIPLRATAKSRS